MADDFEIYQRKAIFSEIKSSKKHDFIEVCEWYNGEGIDVDLSTNHGGKIQMTWEEWELLKKLVKELNKKENG